MELLPSGHGHRRIRVVGDRRPGRPATVARRDDRWVDPFRAHRCRTPPCSTTTAGPSSPGRRGRPGGAHRSHSRSATTTPRRRRPRTSSRSTGRAGCVTGDMATVEADGTIAAAGPGQSGASTPVARRSSPKRSRRRSSRTPTSTTPSWSASTTTGSARRVCAVCQPRRRRPRLTLEDLADHCRARVAGYKVPRDLVVVDMVVRSPVGKADYRWAADVAVEAVGGPTTGRHVSGALAGIRVIEIGGLGPAPFCAMVLADHGADVLAHRTPRQGRYHPAPACRTGSNASTC